MARRGMSELPGPDEAAIVARAQQLTTEDRVLWLVCRAELDGARQRLLRQAIETGIDWNRLARKGRYHRLLDLLQYHLTALGLDAALPPAARAQIEDSRQAARQMQARLTSALPRCTGALDEAGVEHLLVKGPSLQRLYPADVVRAAGDLDLLIHEQDLGPATAALERCGFDLHTPLPPGLSTQDTMRYCQTFEQLRFVDGDGAEVELHFRLHNYGPPTATETAWDSVATWTDEEGGARPGLGAEELFVYLVCHLNLHAFGRILWYYDIAEFYRAWGDHLDWDAVARIARARRLGRSFHQSLTWVIELLWPEIDTEARLRSLRPSAWRRATFERIWRRDEVFALGSWIRPFDASRYYLLGDDPFWRKFVYLRRVLLPPRSWLAAHLGCPPRPGVLLRYLANRRRERLDWGRITRRDELLGA